MSFVQNFPFFSIILSLVCAVVSFAANARWARRLSIFLLSASVVLQGSVLVYCAVHHVRYYYMMGHYPAPWGNELTAGILESFLAMLFAGVMLLSVLGGMRRILQDVPADKQKLYWVMVDLAHVALVALCYTNDIFTGYVFIEVLTIASCALLSVRRGGRALIASARYMIFALMGSGLFLIGVIFTYSVTGHLLFPQLHTAIAELWSTGGHRFSVTMSLGLMTAGLAIKSGLFPFHLWMPDTYGQATPASSGILSGVVSKGYIVFLIKVIYQVIGIDVFAASGIQTVLLLFGIGGMIAGSVSAIFARRLTTMIAYSSAAQIGYIYMGLGMGTEAALGAVLFQIVSHALTKPMLFLSGADLMAVSGGHQDFNSLPVYGGHSHLRGLHPQAVLCRRGLPHGLAHLGGAAGAGPVHPAERAVFPVYHPASVGAGGRNGAHTPPELGRRAGPGVRGPEHRCWPAVLWAHGPVPSRHGPVLSVRKGGIEYAVSDPPAAAGYGGPEPDPE